MSAPNRARRPGRTARTAWTARTVAAAAAGLTLGLTGCSSDLSVTAPDAEQRRQTASQLAWAAESQEICFGWELDSGWSAAPVSRGSNLGENVPVDSDTTRCPRWVEVRARVNYVSGSSESEDSATVQVQTSPDLSVGSRIEAGLRRFGLDEKAFVDNPALAVSRAALALPLLTAESGAAEPAATPPASAATPPALESAGADFWRDRWVFVLVAAGLVLVAGLFLTVGFVQRRKQRRPAGP
jgi:hypothetical protein